MSEWERMLSGEVYNDFDEELFNKRVEAKKYLKHITKMMILK